ncbi:uncharacterized protein [Littorina saxatilis]|uniref:uncharacterized protein n=1 Tax=Littorina saxatilis TaxID=31220 RepID=UPI0038B514F5
MADAKPEGSEDESEHTLIAQLRSEAKYMGLNEAETTKYLQDSLREVRLADRQSKRDGGEMMRVEREKLEQDRQLKEKEIVMKEKELELERQRLEQDRQLKEKEMEIEREKLAQAERLAGRERESREKEKSSKGKPKLPYFDEKHDDFESYLYRFEKHAISMGWPRSDWVSTLTSLLKGKALTYYQELSVEQSQSYDVLSKHLLKRFRCTEEGFRSHFRSAKPEQSEDMATFFSRLRRYFLRWAELAGVGADFDKLVDLLLREQILSSCSTQLVTFLRESKFTSAEAMIEAADRYREAHPTQSMAAKGNPEPFLSNLSFGSQSANTGNFSGSGRGNVPARRSGRGFNYRGNRGDQKHDRTGQTNYNSSGGFHRGGQGAPRTGRGRGCYTCGDTSHYQRDCPSTQAHFANVSVPVAVDTMVGMSASDNLPNTIQTCKGTVNGADVVVMLDSGCTTVGVRKSLVSDDQLTGETQSCRQFDGTIVHLPMATVSLDCPYFAGKVTVCVIENPACDVILGRIPGTSFECTQVTNAVQTRAQLAREARPFRPLLTAKAPKLDITTDKLKQIQKEDVHLQGLFIKVSQPPAETDNDGESFSIRDGLLYRRILSKRSQKVTWQLVVPTDLRESVLIAAHDGLFGGHMGAGSTFKKIAPFFFWPGYRRDVKKYCRSCTICQKTFPKGRVSPAPLQPVPVIDTPFSRVAIDLIGPISPTSGRGHRWVLTLVDVATRYPEAIPLKSITTEAVAEALVEIFSRVGLPDEILSDRGTQFSSDLMREVCRLLSVAQLHSTPYHPQTNGLVERFNGTLKSLLRRLMAEKPSDWDRYIPAAMFAYREIPQETTGFAPFELLYGRIVKGPSQLLYETWTQTHPDSQQQIVSDYVSKLGSVLQNMVQKAQDAVQSSALLSRRRQKPKAKTRIFSANEKVLVLLPQSHKKMLLKWHGPYPVVKRVNECDYLVETSPGIHKLFHVNLLRKFVTRDPPLVQAGSALGVVSEQTIVPETDLEKVELMSVPVEQTESVQDVVFHESLPLIQKSNAASLLQKHAHMLTDLPGITDLIEHSIELTTETVVNVRQYRLPFESEQTVKQEVEKMLQLGVIEPSTSPFSSPVVLVKKKDGSTRFCIDFRALNKVTRFDAEPIPDPEVLFAKLRDKQFFTKIDLTKGYWQIPMAATDRPKTAFRTSRGLFQFTRMPFGLSTAPSTFARMMRKLDLERFSSFNFFDDILVANDEWEEHLQSLDGVLSVLHTHGLTARPSKVEVGMDSIEFLGHRIGQNTMGPVPAKVSKILRISVPTTKKQVRALLGLVGFYRRYIPNFASVVAPLTDLVKKNQPSKVKWSDTCQKSLECIQSVLSSEPVVLLPDFQKAFTVRTDASSTGIGAVLLQPNEEGELRPILYASRKLLDRETRYSAIERECLAVVWAVDKFHRYVFGRHFFVETDHRPLTYLSGSRTANHRLLRWALALQDHSFTVIPIAGAQNHEADVLSRLYV